MLKYALFNGTLIGTNSPEALGVSAHLIRPGAAPDRLWVIRVTSTVGISFIGEGEDTFSKGHSTIHCFTNIVTRRAFSSRGSIFQ